MKLINKKNSKEVLAVGQIVNLVLAIVAFSFLIGLAEVGVVSGADKVVPGKAVVPAGAGVAGVTKGAVSGTYTNTITVPKDPAKIKEINDILGGAIPKEGTKLKITTTLKGGEFTGTYGAKTLKADELAKLTKATGTHFSGEAKYVQSWLESSTLKPGAAELGVGKEIAGGFDTIKSVETLKDGSTLYKTELGKEITVPKGGDLGAGAKEYYSKIATGKTTEGSWLSGKVLPESWYGGFTDAFLSGIQWAVMAYLAGKMIGSLLGMKKEQTDALATAMAAGFGSGKFAYVISGKLPGWGWGVGLPVGVAVFLLLYKKESTKKAKFYCYPWQAPNGGNRCEECNVDELPCSEYRCKSLGQACEVVNPGTSEERCVYVNPKDVEPPVITPDENELTPGYKYTDVKPFPPGPGFKIVGEEQECAKAFTPLRFGFTTNEPAQCKIEFNHTTSFEEMGYWVGGTNLYKYNHTEQFSLPGPSNLEGENLTIKNDGEWTFFIRCQDKNGNTNEAEYAVRFCVDPSPDTTPPLIRATSMENNGFVAENVTSANVDFYLNEPSDCRWSHVDRIYKTMENEMTCSNQIYEMNAMLLYTCTADLDGISRQGTSFYIRCKDQPGKPENDRNVNKQSYEFNLKGSMGLKIKNLKPNETIYGSTDPAPVELYVESLFGAENGKAICFYSTTDSGNDYILFFNTEDNVHRQRQDLSEGTYTYYYKCIDAAGNVAKEKTTFQIDIDTSAPVIARVYEEDGMLKIVTPKQSECAYSFNDCDFSFIEGTEMPYANTTTHVAEWNKEKTYYIKCRDEFRNEEADCSLVVRPSRKF